VNPAAFIADVNPLLADRVRLAVMATLAAAADPVDFMTLLRDLELTRGNLSTHLRKLEEGALVQVSREFVGRRPRTSYSCTDLGRREVLSYLKQVERLLGAANKGR
jgi:DNA-binding transcriptional ArsR family regulator